VIWAIFAIDYGLRLYLALDRWRFVKSHPLDLIVIAVPFLRPLRLLRLFAIVGVASRRAGHGLHGRATVYVVGVALVVMFASALVVFEAERDAEAGNIDSLGDALWWSMTTVTTVGYGDAFPTTLTGRLTAVALMLTGIALLGVLTAAVAAWFVDRLRAEEAEEVDETLREVRALREEVAALRREMSRDAS
jgi:voltage-gated potassium channel